MRGELEKSDSMGFILLPQSGSTPAALYGEKGRDAAPSVCGSPGAAWKAAVFQSGVSIRDTLLGSSMLMLALRKRDGSLACSAALRCPVGARSCCTSYTLAMLADVYLLAKVLCARIYVNLRH